MRVATRAYKGRPSLLRAVGAYWSLPFPKKTAGPVDQHTGRWCLEKTNAVPGRPYPPCLGRTGLQDARALLPGRDGREHWLLRVNIHRDLGFFFHFFHFFFHFFFFRPGIHLCPMIPMMIIKNKFITYETLMVEGLFSFKIFKIQDLDVVAVVVAIVRRTENSQMPLEFSKIHVL